MLRSLVTGAWGAALVLIVGCQKPQEPITPFEPSKDYNRPLPPGELALRKIDPSQYPDFSRGYYNRNRLNEAVENSLSYLAKPSSQKYFPYGPITHDRAVASLREMLKVFQQIQSPEELNEIIRRDFEVWQSVGCDDKGTVYFTGYYTPIFDGRKQCDEQFRCPLYKMPPDLIKDEEGRILGRKQPDGSSVPYYTRREIEETGKLAGLEIAWLKDPFEAYVCTVQGSAKLRLADGSLFELGYAANNGHEYTPVAHEMINDGLIRAEDLSLQTMIRYFAEHPDQVRPYCSRNDRYVFFQEAPGGPFGSINVPVLPYHTVATDKEVFPRACLAFLDTKFPLAQGGKVYIRPYAGFACDQDTGGAIRAAGRCDTYMGVGPEAEAIAGRTGAEGKLYYVFLKPEKMPPSARAAE